MSLLDIQLVNGPCGDPAVLITGQGPHVLFDAGTLEPLSNKDILKIKIIAISHTHVDHFIGFDRIIRANIPHFRTLEVIGPKGIIENVRGKLSGYTWNLLEPDQIIFIVHEISSDHSIKTVRVSNSTGFKAEILASTQSTTKVAEIDLHTQTEFKIQAVVVDHGMDVLAFQIVCKDLQSVDKDQLAKIGLKPGPWIGEVQEFQSSGGVTTKPNTHIEIDGKIHSLVTLAQALIKPKSGQRIVYITDMAFNAHNLNQIETLCPKAVNTLICEANFRVEDLNKARAKSHLTTRQAALLAKLVQANSLKIFHISNSYGGDAETSEQQSQTALLEFTALSIAETQILASNEFTQ